MRLSEFEYRLPEKLIAQEFLPRRDESRLLVLNRKENILKEIIFQDIVKCVKRGNLFVLNDTRVLKARLTARRKTGGRLEILLLKEKEPGIWDALVKPGRKALVGEKIFFDEDGLSAEVIEKTAQGGRLIKFNTPDIKGLIDRYGKMPVPHYIKKELKTPERYQTVYAKKEGAVAAPTAGLHFTKELIDCLASSGIEIVYITLHCGLATFRPVKTPDIREHKIESEFFEIDSHAAESINRAKRQARKVVAVGTTVVRALETAKFVNESGVYEIKAQKGETSLYIHPGYKFKIVDTLLTNFHLPCSTNLILVSAFAGVEFIRRSYEHAIKKRFRFYSLGDAMLIQ